MVCSLCIAFNALYSTYYILCFEFCEVYSLYCIGAVHSMHLFHSHEIYLFWSLHFILCIIFYALGSLHWALSSMHSLCSVHCIIVSLYYLNCFICIEFYELYSILRECMLCILLNAYHYMTVFKGGKAKMQIAKFCFCYVAPD